MVVLRLTTYLDDNWGHPGRFILLTSFAVEDFDQSWIFKNINEEVLKEFDTPKNKKQKLGYIPAYLHT